MSQSDGVQVQTLASLNGSAASNGAHSPELSRQISPVVTEALVTAASRTHEQSLGDPSKTFLKLGGICVIDHILIGLAEAGFQRAVVLAGKEAAKLEEIINAGKESLYPDLKVEILHLGVDWTQSRSESILAAKALFTKPFLICPADHLYETVCFERLARSSLETASGACLVETDLEGMVGLPSTTVHVAYRPLDKEPKIAHVGWNLESYNGIDAGLFLTTPVLFDLLETLKSRQPYFSLADAQAMMANSNDLLYIKTKGATWFSVENDNQLNYSKENLTKVGQNFTLDDGTVVQLLGHPKKVQTSPSTGGDWAEFSVQKWRSAVFTTKSYFNQLYEDTTDFLRDYLQKLGGAEEACLIEIGCGTGEALVPLYDDAKFCLGVEINQDFVDFCIRQTEKKYQDKVGFVCGDAEFLPTLIAASSYSEFLKGTKKLVACVGNTIGIIPEPKKTAIYKTMAELAGPDGYVVTVYWNGNCFGDALQHFYSKNPQLCGPFTGECIDINECTLQTPSGYCTKWTTPLESQEVLQRLGLEVVEVVEKGRGVLTVSRVPQNA